jgi:hypothetical protein
MFPFSHAVEEEIADIDPEVEIKDISIHDLSIYEKCEEGGKEYVAGFISAKLMEKYPDLSRHRSEYTPENGLWVRMLSEGGMVEPSAFWFSYFRKFEEYFDAIHPYGKVSREPDIVKRLTEILIRNYKEVPERAIKLYATTRTMIRISSINRQSESRKFELQERRRNSNTGPVTEEEPEHEDHENVQDVMKDEDIDEFLGLLDLSSV